VPEPGERAGDLEGGARRQVQRGQQAGEQLLEEELEPLPGDRQLLALEELPAELEAEERDSGEMAAAESEQLDSANCRLHPLQPAVADSVEVD